MSLCLATHHTLKTYGEVGVLPHIHNISSWTQCICFVLILPHIVLILIVTEIILATYLFPDAHHMKFKVIKPGTAFAATHVLIP